jgi:hypothetical protein
MKTIQTMQVHMSEENRDRAAEFMLDHPQIESRLEWRRDGSLRWADSTLEEFDRVTHVNLRGVSDFLSVTIDVCFSSSHEPSPRSGPGED